MFNKEQTDLLFKQNSVLFGDVDGMPRYRAMELFGEEAVSCVVNVGDRCGFYDVYGIGNHGIVYLTHRGFRAAATYVNIQEIKTKEATRIKIED